MKKVFLLLSVIIIGFFSCKNQGGSDLFLFNNVSFTLQQDEKVSTITNIEKDKFFSYFNEQAPQIPIYKYIKTSTYTIYIALPYNTTIQNFSNSDFLLCNRNTLTQVEDSVSHYNQYDCMGEFVSEYVVSLGGNIIYFLASTPSEAIADSLFSLDAMKNRFILK